MIRSNILDTLRSNVTDQGFDAATLRSRIQYWWPAWYRLLCWPLNLLRRRFVSLAIAKMKGHSTRRPRYRSEERQRNVVPDYHLGRIVLLSTFPSLSPDSSLFPPVMTNRVAGEDIYSEIHTLLRESISTPGSRRRLIYPPTIRNYSGLGGWKILFRCLITRFDWVSTLLPALFNGRVEITRRRNVTAQFQRVIVFRIIKHSAGICIDNFIMPCSKMWKI